MSSFTHFDDAGRVRMVDVSGKAATNRTAVAQGWVTLSAETMTRIREQNTKKGNVLETARIAGIMAAKKTADLIPMCHPLCITHAAIDFAFEPDRQRIRIEASVRLTGQTGVEMEALTAVSVAALTLYDMCKSYDRGMSISEISLVEKTGGKTGTFTRRR